MELTFSQHVTAGSFPLFRVLKPYVKATSLDRLSSKPGLPGRDAQSLVGFDLLSRDPRLDMRGERGERHGSVFENARVKRLNVEP